MTPYPWQNIERGTMPLWQWQAAKASAAASYLVARGVTPTTDLRAMRGYSDGSIRQALLDYRVWTERSMRAQRNMSNQISEGARRIAALPEGSPEAKRGAENLQWLQAGQLPPMPHPDGPNQALGPNVGGQDGVYDAMPGGTGSGGGGGILLIGGALVLALILLKKK